MKHSKIKRDKVLILLIYVVSIIILLWLLFISFKDTPNHLKGNFRVSHPQWQTWVETSTLTEIL